MSDAAVRVGMGNARMDVADARLTRFAGHLAPVLNDTAATQRMFSVEVGPEVSGETRVRRCASRPDSLMSTRICTDGPAPTTLYEVGLRSVAKFGSNPMCGYRPRLTDTPAGAPTFGPYQWVSYAEFFDKAMAVGAAFQHLGLKSGDMIALYSVNRMEWCLCEHAGYTRNLTTVPLYDTLGADATSFIVNQAKVSTICTSIDLAPRLINNKASLGPLKTIVIFDISDHRVVQRDLASIRATADAVGVKIVTVTEMIKTGAASKFLAMANHTPPKVGDIATICYTSGTTGTPKGLCF